MKDNLLIVIARYLNKFVVVVGFENCEVTIQEQMSDKKEADKKEEPKKNVPPPPGRATRKRKKGESAAVRIPTVTPSSKCKLRLVKLERIKDYLLMEQEFIQNQEI